MEIGEVDLVQACFQYYEKDEIKNCSKHYFRPYPYPYYLNPQPRPRPYPQNFVRKKSDAFFVLENLVDCRVVPELDALLSVFVGVGRRCPHFRCLFSTLLWLAAWTQGADIVNTPK